MKPVCNHANPLYTFDTPSLLLLAPSLPQVFIFEFLHGIEPTSNVMNAERVLSAPLCFSRSSCISQADTSALFFALPMSAPTFARRVFSFSAAVCDRSTSCLFLFDRLYDGGVVATRRDILCFIGCLFSPVTFAVTFNHYSCFASLTSFPILRTA